MTAKDTDRQAILKAKLIWAEANGSGWLADGNEAAEAGKHAKAEKCYAKAQFWLDRANSIRDKLHALKAV